MNQKAVPEILVKLWHARRALEKVNMDHTDAYEMIALRIDEIEDEYDLGFSELLVFGSNRPENSERTNQKTGNGSTRQVRLVIDVAVHNEKHLLDYAMERYHARWGKKNWKPENLGDAVLEALISSSPGPDPVEYGIEIVDKKVEFPEA